MWPPLGVGIVRTSCSSELGAAARPRARACPEAEAADAGARQAAAMARAGRVERRRRRRESTGGDTTNPSPGSSVPSARLIGLRQSWLEQGLLEGPGAKPLPAPPRP